MAPIYAAEKGAQAIGRTKGGSNTELVAGPRHDIYAVEPLLPWLRRYCAVADKGFYADIVFSNVGRFGLYFVETGANQRGGNVLYDRADSAFSLAGPAT